MTIKFTSLAASVALLALTPAAFAADMPMASAPQTSIVEQASFDWTGFYVGVYGGYAWGEADDALAAGTDDLEGGLAGGTVGYNHQMGSWLVGLEADGGWAGIEDDSAGFEANIDWTSTVRGRVGYLFNDSFLVYATGGAAIAGLEVDGDEDTRLGYVVGGGVEAALTDNISAKVEYNYIDLGDDDIAGRPVDIDAHVVKGGINYRF